MEHPFLIRDGTGAKVRYRGSSGWRYWGTNLITAERLGGLTRAKCAKYKDVTDETPDRVAVGLSINDNTTTGAISFPSVLSM